MNTTDEKEQAQIKQYGHLNYICSLSGSFVHFNPKDLAVDGLTAMIKVVAQMKNLRRGHTSQGEVKRIEIDQTDEGYANFMAPGRMRQVAYDSEHAKAIYDDFVKEEKDMSEEEKKKEAHVKRRKYLNQRVKDASTFERGVLKPRSDTYLTAEWDEMIPFPSSMFSSALSLLPFLPRYPADTDPVSPSQHGNFVSPATAPPTIETPVVAIWVC